MRAARIHAYGPPEVLRVEEAERPGVGPRDVLVAVRAAAVNPVDWKIRRGYQRALIHYRLPQTLGLDFSGTVEAVGARVTRVAVGDDVFGSPSHRRQGTYAEYTSVDERQLALKPKKLSHEEAAGIPLAGLTAWKALVQIARVEPGQRVLVHAGAGGVGTLAIQIAKHFGCEVATTCSAQNLELVRELGADVAIDYKKEPYDEILADLDVALDALGGEHKERSAKVLRKGGILVSIVNDMAELVSRHGAYGGAAVALVGVLATKLRMWWGGKRFSQALRSPDGEALAQLGAVIDAGGVCPVIDRVLPLESIVEAHAYSESGRARGKIIITMGR